MSLGITHVILRTTTRTRTLKGGGFGLTWRKRLAKQRKDFWEDEMVLHVLIEGLGDGSEEVERYGGGGSRHEKRPNIDRSHVEGHERMAKDYFADEHVYGPGIFRWRYRMQRGLF